MEKGIRNKLFRQRPRFTDFNQDDIEEIHICKCYLCISEKKDLVELVIRQNASSSSTVSGSGGQQQESSSSSSRQANPAPAQSSSSSRRAPEERQKSFPKAYVESTHRHEWLEKMNENANQVQAADQVHLSCEEDDDDFIVVTPVTPMTSKF